MIATAPAALTATRLGRRFRGGWALRDCDFTVPAGRVTGLVGPNGAGKSTLLHLATGLLQPTGGELLVYGERPGTDAARRHIAFLAQVGTLSPGQCTRIALALAFGKWPQLLLLDEPLADLDPLVRHEIMGLVMAEVAERGVTVVLSSHILSELESVCDHVLLLREGRVRLAGDAQELIDGHLRITGRAEEATDDGLPTGLDRTAVVASAVTGRQVTALLRVAEQWTPPARMVAEHPTLEELLLAHLRAPAGRFPDDRFPGGRCPDGEAVA
ncbi:ATP-binding cassette domain-containing protein [Streptomyces orinoci]|uniref:ATP-binding cassette domain-containing protein n=1 Tax=Streptomyces orinoci TaxID=67339 RepID=A0ABV3JYG3_STRON|nr:ATP-binding cassette domain-containing protein [Streptomyces orinoci]